MSESTKLTKKDLWSVFWRQIFIRSCNNFERQQNIGFTNAMIPVIKRCYTDPEEQKEAMKRHMELFLTQDMVSSLPIGIAAAMEERYANERDIEPSTIDSVKTALMGPLAGLGDSLINGTARPILAGLATTFALSGSITGTVFFLLGMTAITLSVRYFGVFKGYERGVQLVYDMQKSGIIKKLTELSAIAAFTVCGGFVALIVSVYLPWQMTAGESTIKLQETLDGLMPGILPLLYTLLMYYLINKRKISPVILMLATMAFGIIGVYLGFLGLPPA